MHFGLHYAVIPDILDAGVNLLTEKPICISSETAKKFIQKVEEKKIIYHVGYMKRCDPASIFMKQKIAEWKKSGEFGKLTYLRISMPPGDWVFNMEPPLNLGDNVQENIPFEKVPSWMDKDIGDKYIAFVNYYIHQINLIRYLLGEDYTVKYTEPSGKILVAESKSGVPIVLEMDTYNLSYEWKEEYVAFFNKGKISLSLPAPMARQQSGKIEIYQNKEKNSLYLKPVFLPNWCMYEQARIFVETVRNESQCISPATDALKDLEVAESYIKLLVKK
jgi:predicted dehydrogenase